MSAREEQSKTGRFADVLANSTFRWLWIASIVSTMGTSMHDISAAWLMTSLERSPLFISLVQTMSTLPIFLLSIPAGALADIADRRQLLLVTQTWMMFAAAVLGMLTLFHLTSPAILLTLLFLLAVGNALNIPPWQALTADLVDKQNLQRGIVLQSLGSNIARAAGPAVGGLAVSALGAGWVFLLNALSFAGTILVLLRWKPDPKVSSLPAERFVSSIRNCLNYSLHSPELTTVLIRTFAFVFFASAGPALMPVIVRHELHRGPEILGMVLAFNAVGAMLMSPYVKSFQKDRDRSCLIASLIFAVALLGIATIKVVPAICFFMLLAGASWLVVNSTLNAATQVSSPDWVRARTISVQQLVFFGAIAIGSTTWGVLATFFHTSHSLRMAAAGMAISTLIISSRKLSSAFVLHLEYTPHWGDIHLDHPIPLNSGPVMVKLEYVIDPSRTEEFKVAMKEMRTARYRSGALRWELYQDVGDRSHFVEVFLSEDWGGHLRQHQHVPLEDKLAEEKVRAFQGGQQPVRMHLIYNNLDGHLRKLF